MTVGVPSDTTGSINGVTDTSTSAASVGATSTTAAATTSRNEALPTLLPTLLDGTLPETPEPAPVDNIESREPVGALGTWFYVIIAVVAVVLCCGFLVCLICYNRRDNDKYARPEPMYDPNYHVPYENAERARDSAYDVVPDDMGYDFASQTPSDAVHVEEIIPEHMEVQWLADDESL